MLYLELARRQRGWSQADLGGHPQIKIDRAFISLIERQLALPIPDQLKRLSSVLGVPLDLLMEEVPALDAAKTQAEDEAGEQARG